MERSLKGTVILDLVKIIRALKDLPWDEYLQPEDWEIINSMALPTAWYPIESYMRMGLAVFKLAAGGSEEAVRQFGRQAMQGLFNGPYRPFLDKGDPHQAVGKFIELRRSLFNFSRMEAEKVSENSLRMTISELGDLKEGVEVFALLAQVHLEEIAAMNGAREVRSASRVDFKEDGPVLTFDLEWS